MVQDGSNRGKRWSRILAPHSIAIMVPRASYLFIFVALVLSTLLLVKLQGAPSRSSQTLGVDMTLAEPHQRSEEQLNHHERAERHDAQAIDPSASGQAKEAANSSDQSDAQSQPAPDPTSTSTELRVNGQNVAVPAEGHATKTIRSNGSETVVDIRVDGESSTSTGSSHSSTTIDVRTESSSTGEDDPSPDSRYRTPDRGR